MNHFLRSILFLFASMVLRAEQPVSIKLDVEKKTSIRDAVVKFNAVCNDWLKANNVPPLEDVEVSNALALGSDSYFSLDKPALAKLAGTSFAEGRLPAGSAIILRNGAWVGPSEAEARNVPFVYVYVFITTIPIEKDDEGVPSLEEIDAAAWIPVRLTKRPENKPSEK